MRPAAGIHLIGASAGSGKTERLTREVVLALDPAAAGHIAVEGLAAVTYTRKAAGELGARIQRSLIAASAVTEATLLPLAYVGTVHAICLRLLEEHAIEAGLSPHIEVVAGDEATMLRQAMERCLPVELRDRMEHLAGRLQIFWDARVQRHDWLRPVTDIMELARANRMTAERLPEMARRSAETLLALLPPPAPSGAALDDALLTELERADRALARSADATATTRAVKEQIAAAIRRVRRAPLSWSEWLKLSKLRPAKASTAVVAPLVRAAADGERHPQLRQDLADFTAGMFEAARAGLDGYAQWKSERRLIYEDMIDLGLRLAEDPAVSSELGRRLAMLVVDEFQDTSPLQLALFTRVHQLAQRSVFVGDAKQCIFEYAGADPLLMEAMARWVRESGGSTEPLSRNYRSRPELVEAANRIFAPAFARFGADPADVVVEPERRAPDELGALPPLGIFWLDGRCADDDAAGIAEGIARMLSQPETTPVVDRATGTGRPVGPADIAVLTATNDEAEAVARALAERRIGAALARPGLMATPEGTLIEAALRWLVDRADTLAATSLDALTGWNDLEPDVYLARRIAACRAPAGTEGLSGSVADASWRPSLESVRSRLDHLAPSETVHLALAALDATTLCARWPDPDQRLGNLDAIQALAAAYEGRCVRQREAATLVGLLRYFDEAKTPAMTRDGERARDEQHVRGDGAVTVSTYHRAKGLEWTVVVLASLDRDQRRSAFDVTPESDRPDFDPADPLGGRWIRYWPWPFGAQRTAPLAVAAGASAEGRRVKDREDRERVRLLYVGFTRARDHLVLAIRRSKGQPQCAWLDELASAPGQPLVRLPTGTPDGEVGAVQIGPAQSVAARVFVLAPGQPPPIPPRRPGRRFFRPAGPSEADRPRYWIAPSRAAAEWPESGPARIGEVVPLARRVELRRAGAIDWESAGRAIHAFLAADPPGLDPEGRLERATRILSGASLLGHLRPEWILASSDALRAFIASRWPRAEARHEVPVTAFLRGPHGRRRIEGTIDLLIDAGPDCAVIDHKSFPAWSESACRAKAAELAPQLMAYFHALRLLGCTPSSLWFHFPLAGVMVEIHPQGPTS